MTDKKEYSGFEEMLSIIYNDMKNLDSDKDFEKIRKIYSNQMSVDLPQKIASGVTKRILTYPTIIKNFKGGKWDHKVPAKKVVDQRYHKTEKNFNNKPAAVFGTTIPGDDKYFYDHDLWGNISYGYLLKKAGLTDFEIEKAAILDDILQSRGKGSSLDDILQFNGIDSLDDPMVKIGIALYDKYGDEPSIDNLRQEIINNKDKLRRYEKNMLEDRRYRTKGGEDIEAVAKKYEMTADQLVDYNKKHKQGIKELNKEQSLLPNIKPLIPDPEERFAMKQDKIPNTSVPSGNKQKLLTAVERYDNKHEDVLYKHPSKITENEMKDAVKFARYENADPVVRRKFEDKNTEFHGYYYSTDPVKLDATGRLIDEGPKFSFPKEISELKTKDDVPMKTALQKVVERIEPLGVKSLQKGLNGLGTQVPKLKEDGVLGPKTISRIKESLAGRGLDEVNKSIAFGEFSSLLEDNRKRDVPQSTLKNTMTAISPQSGGLVLQRGLNEAGRSKPNFTPLKEDNDIGEKTTAAFNQIKEEKENELTSYFQKNMEREEKEREREELEKEHKRAEHEKQKEQERLEKEKEREQAEAEAQAAEFKVWRDE